MFKMPSFQTFFLNKKKKIPYNMPKRYSFVTFFFLRNAYPTDPAEEASERTFSSLVWFSTIIITNPAIMNHIHLEL